MLYEREGIEDTIGRKILDAAVAIIAQDGYENLTIRRVAKESGCSNSAIYVRFEDKDALARAVAALHAKPFLLTMDECYQKEDNVRTILDKITKGVLEKVYEMDLESAHIQMVYCGSLKHSENPFIKRVEGYVKYSMSVGEISRGDALAMAATIISFFWGFAFMARSNKEIDLETAKKMLEAQNEVILRGLLAREESEQEAGLWGILKEQGVNVDKALERLKGNKEAYRDFLKEFFEDPDFDALQESIEAQRVREAFGYAHGLKGMAGNLGLEQIHSKISVLVEILRQGSLEGAADAYEEVREKCRMIQGLL